MKGLTVYKSTGVGWSESPNTVRILVLHASTEPKPTVPPLGIVKPKHRNDRNYLKKKKGRK